MTTLRRRPSRAGIPSTPTKKLPAQTGARGAATSNGGELAARPTLSVAVVGTEDVPILVKEPPQVEEQVGLLRLVSAIDGALTVAELAKACKLDVEHARALVASLGAKGFVTLKVRPEAKSERARPPSGGPKGEEYWLAGLKPRTK